MKFGCCIRSAEDISSLKEIGFDYYEFAGSVLAEMDEAAFAELRRRTEEHTLPCLGLNAYCLASPAIVGPAYDPDPARRYAELLCGRGRQLGIRNLGIGAPLARRLPAGFPRQEADRQCADFLRVTCETAERFGIRVLLEAINSRMCSYINTTAEAVSMLQRLPYPNLALVLDFYHMEVMGESLSSVALAAPYLAHVHVSSCEADLSRGFPASSDLGLYTCRFAALKDAAYDGSVSIEPDRFDPAAAAAALRMLRTAKGESLS
ncbi:MAG: sugar phosphate isomerase/epimerase [Oscillospiraceae bacterium]|nr:sugar phosphate isomerase/epimerase [Oscillospiraceae bacterium]